MAYCAALGLPEELLIYASERLPEVHIVERAGVILQVVGVRMTESPRKLEARVREAAERLVRQATRQRGVRKAAG